MLDSILGTCVRTIPPSSSKKCIYLTFDDGPEEPLTEQLLHLLEKHKAKVTFFVVGHKAAKRASVVKRMIELGHSIGDHSLDHQYKYFFSSQDKMKSWITESQDLLTRLIGEKPVGFRSPAGVRTPILFETLNELNIPHVLWKVRYYDAVFGLKPQAVAKSLKNIRSGDIVLLHDSHSGQRAERFLAAVEFLILSLRSEGFEFCSLKPPFPT